MYFSTYHHISCIQLPILTQPQTNHATQSCMLTHQSNHTTYNPMSFIRQSVLVSARPTPRPRDTDCNINCKDQCDSGNENNKERSNEEQCESNISSCIGSPSGSKCGSNDHITIETALEAVNSYLHGNSWKGKRRETGASIGTCNDHKMQKVSTHPKAMVKATIVVAMKLD